MPGFGTGSWLHVTPDDAGAVGTEVGALVQTGRCPHVFFATNMKRCFGYMDTIGKDTIPRFSVPWWFRTDFHAAPDRSQHVEPDRQRRRRRGRRVGQRPPAGDARQGAGRLHPLHLRRHQAAARGANALALKVYPNDPNTMFTLDNVDWTQIPPDNNTGIQFPIQLHTSGPLALADAHVVQHDARNFSSAQLTLTGAVSNVTGSRRRPGSSAPASARPAAPPPHLRC